MASSEVGERLRYSSIIEQAVNCGCSFDNHETAPGASTKVQPILVRNGEKHTPQSGSE